MQTAEGGAYWSMWHFTGRKKGLDGALENTPALRYIFKEEEILFMCAVQ